MENHEITEVTEAMIFGNNAVNTEIFRVFFVIIHEYLHNI